jgi:hypothetical protein
VYVNRRGCPARDKFVGVGFIYGRLYDGFGVSRGISDVSGRKAFRFWLNYELASFNRWDNNFYRAFLRRHKRLAQGQIFFRQIFVWHR